MKNLIAFSSVCLAGLFLGSCASSGAIAENDVYMQQSTATSLFEDETDPTSFANFKAQEREEIIVTQNYFTPFTTNLNVQQNFGLWNTPIYPWSYPNFYHQNYTYVQIGMVNGFGFFGQPYNYYNPYFYQNHFFVTPYYNANNGYGGYGGYTNTHASNYYYGHRKSATVGAPRNSNYPSTMKSAQLVGVSQTPSKPIKINRNNSIAEQNTIRRDIGTEYQIGNGHPSKTTVKNNSSAISPVRNESFASSPRQQPSRTFTSPKSSSNSRSTQPIYGTSRRNSGSKSSGRSTTIGQPRNGGNISLPRTNTNSTPSTSTPRISSPSGSSSRGSSSGSGTISTRRR